MRVLPYLITEKNGVLTTKWMIKNQNKESSDEHVHTSTLLPPRGGARVWKVFFFCWVNLDSSRYIFMNGRELSCTYIYMRRRSRAQRERFWPKKSETRKYTHERNVLDLKKEPRKRKKEERRRRKVEKNLQPTTKTQNQFSIQIKVQLRRSLKCWKKIKEKRKKVVKK